MANKVKYGLSQVHIFPIEKDDSTGTKYGVGFALPGAVTLSLEPSGSSDPFYADDVPYYTAIANNGYTGSLEIAMLNDDFYTKILGMKLDEKTGLMLENVDDMGKEFAMAFQFKGDEKNTRHIVYRCSATRPKIEGETVADKVTPKTDSFDFTAIPRISDGIIKAKAEQGAAVYDKFFTAVQDPGVVTGA
ncbi:major tail protein [uncultured Murdochiella sp.]|uniref:major tail protein n=1 Tax=uncultured Murdochiella sp. TaxID=1586095 RepID=UPI0028053DD3|nr:major tail protein [uncultured Murdochiella sp.]